VAPFFTQLEALLEADAAPDGAFIILQLGLQLPLNGGEALVASGAYDNAIAALRFSLVALARPVYLRVGYEFNGNWNNYSAPSYVGAYRRIAASLHSHPVLNMSVALVWDGSCDTSNDPAPFWPGSDVVDWQGINIFSDGSAPTATAPQSCLWYWLTDSAAAGLPLLIGESTPRGQSTASAGTLAAWHQPFLQLLSAEAHPNLKLFSYIDEDWDSYARWQGWGDSRIETATPQLQAAWRSFLGGSRLVNRLQKAELLAILRLPPDLFDYKGRS
jgi:hypothetical protein